MSFDKVKTLRAAEKYLELGKIAPAIKEYCQIVAVDPNDFTTLNMLGDLYVRVGNHSEAVSCFRRIADHYRDQGFGLKAIAMFKKIDRLHPNDIEIAAQLADLYAEQDLVVEARTHYLAIADSYDRSGATQSALEVLRKIADLDPQNTEIRTRLAGGYFKLGMKAQAAGCFAEAGQSLLARGALDDALDAFGRALEIDATDYTTLKGLLATHSARGTADEAAELLEEASRSNPENCELISLLASAYFEADEPNQAERVTGLLVAKEPAAYLRFIEIARLYLHHGKVAEAVRVVANITEQMLAEREQHQLLQLIEELLAGDSDNVQALRLLVRAHWWLRDMENLTAALERLAEAAQAEGLEKDERYALTQLTRLAPGQAHHLERLAQLGGAEESASGEALPEFERVSAASSPMHDEFVTNSDEPVTAAGESGFEWNPVAEVSEEWSSPAEVSSEREFTFESIVAEELPSSPHAGPADSSDDSRADAMRKQELESVDFYIAQGYVDIAIDTLNLLEQQCGSHPEIELRREQITHLQNGTVPETVAPAPEPVAAVEFEPNVFLGADTTATVDDRTVETTFEFGEVQEFVRQKPAVASVPAIDPGLAEIFEEYRASSEGDSEAETNGDYETHYNLGLAYKDMDLFEDALEEFQKAASLASPRDGTPRYLQCCNLLGHCFMQTGVPELAVKWFNKGLSAANVSEDERLALTYEIAAAYEQAGDLNRALEFFTEVYGSNVSYRSVSERLRSLKARLSDRNGRNAQKESRSEQLVN